MTREEIQKRIEMIDFTLDFRSNELSFDQWFELMEERRNLVKMLEDKDNV